MIGRLAVASFFLGPAAVVALAVSARTTHVVESYRAVMERVHSHIDAARAASASERVELPLLLAVAASESAGNPRARSSAGAVGLMQLEPATADEMAKRAGEPRPDLEDPAVSLRLGARYLRRQLDRFSDSACAKELALAAYNAGPGRVDEWLARGPAPDQDSVLDWIRFRETRAFVRRVLDYETRWRARTSAH